MINKIEKLKLSKKILVVLAVILICLILGYLALVAVYCLPRESMQKNLEESSTYFETEGAYHLLMHGENSQLDNFTDALMLLTAAHPRHSTVFKDAINGEHYSVSAGRLDMGISTVYHENADQLKVVKYTRYWHGYLVFLKPLLSVFNYGYIRSIMMFVQLGLFVGVALKLSKRESRLVFPFFVTGVFLNLPITAISLQYNTVLIISMLAMLAIMSFEKRLGSENSFCWSLFFLLIGILTSYFDLLTYPLVSLGLPLTLWIVLFFSNKTIDNIKRIVQLSFFWCIGYGGMWSLKWVLGSVITRTNLISDAINQILGRTSSDFMGTRITYFDVIYAQLRSSFQIPWLLLVVVSIVLFVFFARKTKTINWTVILTFGMLGLYPLVWYFVLKNHSYIHSWFTYRELAITNFAIISSIMLHQDKGNRKKNVHEMY